MSTAPHLWRSSCAGAPRRRAARRRRPLPQPHRARGRRAPAPAARHGRGARAGDDARDRRRRAGRRGVVPRARRPATTSCWSGWASTRSSAAPRSAACRRTTIARVGARVRDHAAGAAAPRRRRAAPPGRPDRLPHARLPAGARRRLAPRRRRLLLHPDGDRRRRDDAVSSSGADLRPGRCAQINMSQLGAALTDPALDPPVDRARRAGHSNPARSRPTRTRVLAGLRREDLFTVVLEQFMTDTARHADVVLPATTQLEHLDALFSWGHHYFTLQRAAIEPLRRGEAEHGDLPAARRAGSGSTTRRFARDRRGDARGAARRRARRRRRSRAARARLDEDRPRPGRRRRTPRAASGRRPASSALRADWLADAGVDPLPFYDPPAEVDDADARARFPLALITPKTHLFLNSTLRQPAAPALGAQPEPFVVVHPDDAARARDRRRRARAGLQRPRRVPVARARVSDDTRPGVLVAPMGWWNARLRRRRRRQATTSQRLTELGAAPTFNDNRVELEPA